MHIENRRCLLTGASGGIGRAVALELSRRGMRLVLSGRRHDALADLSTEIGLSGGRAEVVIGDLTAPQGAERIVSQALALSPQLDMVINCAGISHFGTFEETSSELLESLLRTNVLAPMRLIQAALPALRGQEKGLIVNVGSIFGSIGFPCFTAYSTTKFALRGFSEALRRELAGSNVDVLYFAPRYTRTAINSDRVSRMAAAVKMKQDEPKAVARSLALAIENRSRDRYLGWPEKFFVRLNALFPRLVDGALIKQAGQMRPYALERLA
ncbi:MAG: SDR family oxidoreductase [Panacagrimonas sp.]